MPFRPRWTEAASTQFEKLQAAASASVERRARSGNAKASTAEGLFEQVEKCARLLLLNPRHPGLPTHESHAIDHPYLDDETVFEAYVQNKTPGAYRLFWCYGPEPSDITILAITPHP